MKIIETYKYRNYKPENVIKAYVQYSNYSNTFQFCEVNSGRNDIRQGTVEGLPLDIEEEAKARAGVWPSYVEIDKELLQ